MTASYHYYQLLSQNPYTSFFLDFSGIQFSAFSFLLDYPFNSQCEEIRKKNVIENLQRNLT